MYVHKSYYKGKYKSKVFLFLTGICVILADSLFKFVVFHYNILIYKYCDIFHNYY